MRFGFLMPLYAAMRATGTPVCAEIAPSVSPFFTVTSCAASGAAIAMAATVRTGAHRLRRRDRRLRRWSSNTRCPFGTPPPAARTLADQSRADNACDVAVAVLLLRATLRSAALGRQPLERGFGAVVD